MCAQISVVIMGVCWNIGTSKAVVSEQTEMTFIQSCPTGLIFLFTLYIHIYTPLLLVSDKSETCNSL